MRSVVGALLVLVAVIGANGQEARRFDPKTSYTVFAAYSNDSSPMIIGQSRNRKLFAAGVDYSRRLGGRSIYSWRYQVEVVPLMLLRNPLLTTDINVTPISGVNPISVLGLPPGSYRVANLQAKQCANASGSGFEYGQTSANGPIVPVMAYSFTNQCSNPWTYGGGVSPLGQKVNFLPRSRVQPYFAVNAGFAAFAETVPSNAATMFNFSFEFGGGVEWNARAGRAWSLDYRYHHISNAGRGVENPGVDNGTFRVAYSFWR